MERVGVEEAGAVVGRRGGDDVEQDPLDQVGVARVALREQKPPGQHDRADGGARLRIRAVRWKKEIFAERLVLVPGSDAAGDVGAPGDGVPPLPGNRGEQLGVAGLDRDVDGAGGQVDGADRVPAQRLGLAHRHVVLEVRPPELDVGERPAPAPLDEGSRLFEVAAVAGDPVQLGERRLDLGVPADRRDAAGPEDVADVVGGAHRRDGEVVAGAEGARRGHPGLDQVAVGVELVAPFQVAVAGLLAGPPEVGVQVPVRLLRGQHPGDDRPVALFHLRVAGAAVLPGHRLEELVDLGVGEFPPAAFLRWRREVAQPAGLLQPVFDVGEGPRPVGLLALLPETFAQGHLAQAERSQPAVAGRGGGAATLGPPVGGRGGQCFFNGHVFQPLSAPDMKPRT